MTGTSQTVSFGLSAGLVGIEKLARCSSKTRNGQVVSTTTSTARRKRQNKLMAFKPLQHHRGRRLTCSLPPTRTFPTMYSPMSDQEVPGSPSLGIFRSSQRRAKKTFGSVMKSLRLSPSPKNLSRKAKKQVNENVETSKAPKTPRQVSPETTLESSVRWLSSQSLEDNKKGLELLIVLTKMNKIICSPRADISDRIVSGGNDSTANRVRNLLLSFMCDDIDLDATDKDDGSAVSALSDDFFGLDDESTWDDDLDDEDNLSGRHWGALHCLTLRVLSNCLEHLASPRSFKSNANISIDYSGTFWNSIIQTLRKNIESGVNAEVTGFSLRCLRLLVSLDSNMILSMLKYTMLPYIMNLQEYDDSQNYPMVQEEATKLLKLVV